MRQPENGSIMTRFEYEHDVRAVESLSSGLYYLEDDNQKSIGIMTIRNGKKSYAVLSKKQAYALIDEFKDVCDLYFEEGD